MKDKKKAFTLSREFYFVPDTGKRAQATWWLFSWLLSIKKQDTFPIKKKKMLKKNAKDAVVSLVNIYTF